MMNFFSHFSDDETLLFSIGLTARTCVVSLIILAFSGVLIAYVLAKKKNTLTAILEFFITLPLVFPPIGTGFILLMLLGRNGFLSQLGLRTDIIFTRSGVYLAALIAGLPLVVKPVQSALERNVFKLAEVLERLGKISIRCLSW